MIELHVPAQRGENGPANSWTGPSSGWALSGAERSSLLVGRSCRGGELSRVMVFSTPSSAREQARYILSIRLEHTEWRQGELGSRIRWKIRTFALETTDSCFLDSLSSWIACKSCRALSRWWRASLASARARATWARAWASMSATCAPSG
jgi:hypothetical protein